MSFKFASVISTLNRVVWIVVFLWLASFPWLFATLPMQDNELWMTEAVLQGRLLRGDPAVVNLYELRWLPIPNSLAQFTLAVLRMAGSAEWAVRVLWSGYFVGFGLGLWLVSQYSSREGAVSAGFLGVMWVFNGAFILGLLAYVLSTVFVWVGILILETQSRRPLWRTAFLMAVVSLGCYLTHLIGYLTLLLIIVVYSITQWWHTRRIWHPVLFVQMIPLSLLVVYTVSRTTAGNVGYVWYDSIFNKIYLTIIQPLSVFVRYPPVDDVPLVNLLNLAVALSVFIPLGVWWRGCVRRSYLLISGLLLIGVGTLQPFSWFGGLVASDGRFMFFGVLLVLTQLWLHCPRPHHVQVVGGSVLLIVLALHTSTIGSIQTPLQQTRQAFAETLETSRQVTVFTINLAPVHNRCVQRLTNQFSYGVFIVYFMSHSAAREAALVNVPTFGTSLLQKRPDGTTTDPRRMNVYEIISQAQLQQLKEDSRLQLATVQTDESVIFIGCAADLDRVRPQINPDLQLEARPEVHMLIYRSTEPQPLLREALR